jgi:hypothetical protein
LVGSACLVPGEHRLDHVGDGAAPGLGLAAAGFYSGPRAGFRPGRYEGGVDLADHAPGFDKMDEVSGDGYSKLFDDGSLEIGINCHLGDDAILKALATHSSTPS